MNICPYCHAKLKKANAKFCSSCGKKQPEKEDSSSEELIIDPSLIDPNISFDLEGYTLKEPENHFLREDARKESRKEIEEQKMLVEADSFLKSIQKPFLTGFKVIFCGEDGGTKKEDYLLRVAEILYKCGKISSEKPEILNFGSFPKEVKSDVLYIVQDIASAARNLFNMEDFSDEASREQFRYKNILNQILTLPQNVFLLINANLSEKRAFFTLDARIPYVFEEVITFPGLTNAQIYENFLDYLPKRQKDQISEDFKKKFYGFVSRNRRYYPFQNEEFSKYIANYSAKNEILTIPPEKYNAKSLEEGFADIIGMDSVKKEIIGLRNYLLIRNHLEEEGIKMPDFNLHMMFTGNPGVGKQIRLEEPLLTPEGWVKNKEVYVGMKIISGRGHIEEIKGIYPQPKEPFYQITFDDGSTAESSGNHLWPVYKEGVFDVLELDDIRKDYREKEYAIDYVSPVELPMKRLPVSPYVIGVLTATKTSSNRLGFLNPHVLDRYEKEVEKRDLYPRGKDFEHPIETIPEDFMMASIEQRVFLLQGILDVGGMIKDNQVIYRSLSEKFNEQLRALVLSLGGKAILQKEDLFIEFPKEYEHFCFSDPDKKYVGSRKKEDFKRKIASIEYTEDVAGQCLYVSGEDHTFVMSDYVVTHNTTVARIIAKLLFDMGYSREDKLIEVTSKDLVGAYGNQTGMKTNRAIMNAMGGVLFIDEAYALSNSCGAAGAEVIANIVKAMEDYKGDLVCMFAGYALEMQEFIESNSGIESRLAYTFKIEDYTEQELYDIFILKLGKTGMRVAEDAKLPLRKLLSFGVARRNFGNGRFVDKVMQKILTRHATAVQKNPENLMVIGPMSIPDLKDVLAS